MRMKVTAVLLLAIAAATANPTVTTTCGDVTGVSEAGVNTFLGIPYASPPTGDLRFKSPVMTSPANHNCWSGTLAATSFGNVCHQLGSPPSGLPQSEDCLFLNVYAPADADASNPLPVLFWIHGGGLVVGSSSWPGYHPTVAEATSLQAVVVSLNYRLGPFGFLTNSQLQAESHTTSNVGLQDVIAALRWVQTEIGAFGGDPNAVTVHGQSAGGTLVLALMGSPLAKGLFHGAWSMSGSPRFGPNVSQAIIYNDYLFKTVNCSTVECARAVPADTLMSAVHWNSYPYWGFGPASHTFDLPHPAIHWGDLLVVDSYTLPKPPLDALADGSGNRVPFILSSTAQEIDSGPDVDMRKYTWEQYDSYVSTTLEAFGPDFVQDVLSDKLYNRSQPDASPMLLYTSMASDMRVSMGNDLFADTASLYLPTLYRLVITAWPSYPTPLLGFPSTYAFHAIDALFLFDSFGVVRPTVPKSAREDAEVDNMRAAIGEFVRSGQVSNWVPFKPDAKQTTLFENGGKAGSVSPYYHTTQSLLYRKEDLFQYSWSGN